MESKLNDVRIKDGHFWWHGVRDKAGNRKWAVNTLLGVSGSRFAPPELTVDVNRLADICETLTDPETIRVIQNIFDNKIQIKNA